MTKEITATKAEWLARLHALDSLTPVDWPDAVVSAAIDNQLAIEAVRDGVARAELRFIEKYAARDEEGAFVTHEKASESTINIGQGEKPHVELADAEAFRAAREKMLQEEVTLTVRTVPASALRGKTLGEMRAIRWMVEIGVDVPQPNGLVRAEA